MSDEKHHIISYRTYGIVLAALVGLTLISVAITQIELSRWATTAALLLAGVKSTLVLLIFMHLRFDKGIFLRMVLLIIALLAVVIFITMLDFLFR